MGVSFQQPALREWTNLLSNVTSSAKTLYIVFNFKVVYCEMQFGSPKHFACDMYVAYVMCLFVLHATADICALTLATGLILRTNFAALRNH